MKPNYERYSLSKETQQRKNCNSAKSGEQGGQWGVGVYSIHDNTNISFKNWCKSPILDKTFEIIASGLSRVQILTFVNWGCYIIIT